MARLRTLPLALGSALGPFAVTTAFLLATGRRTGSLVLIGWLVALVVGDGLGALCLRSLLPGHRRRAAIVLVYLPLMFAALVVYSFFYTGIVLGKAA